MSVKAMRLYIATSKELNEKITQAREEKKDQKYSTLEIVRILAEQITNGQKEQKDAINELLVKVTGYTHTDVSKDDANEIVDIMLRVFDAAAALQK